MAAKHKYDIIKPPRERNIPFVLQKWREGVTKRPLVYDNSLETLWDVQMGGFGDLDFTGVTINNAEFSVLGDLVWYMIEATGTTENTGTANDRIWASLPVPAYASSVGVWQSVGVRDASSGDIVQGCGWIDHTNQLIVFAKADRSDWTLGAGRWVFASGWYRKAAT